MPDNEVGHPDALPDVQNQNVGGHDGLATGRPTDGTGTRPTVLVHLMSHITDPWAGQRGETNVFTSSASGGWKPERMQIQVANTVVSTARLFGAAQIASRGCGCRPAELEYGNSTAPAPVSHRRAIAIAEVVSTRSSLLAARERDPDREPILGSQS